MAYIPDISHYHPIQNIAQVKANCLFLISKATQGTNYIDPTLNRFIALCEEKSIPYWLYTYLNNGNELAQAKYMVSVCGPRIGKNFVGYILDVEAGNSAAGVKSALDYLKTTGQTMLYTMYAQYNNYKSVINGRGNNCAWWEARYGSNNGQYNSNYPAHSGCDLHQFTSLGYCPGIGANVDLNRICGNKSLDWFVGAGGEVPDFQLKGVNGMLDCTFQIDKKPAVYWCDGFKIRTLYNKDQLKIIQQIYKDGTGRKLPHYDWKSSAPWFLRLQQALNAKEKTFTENFPYIGEPEDNK